MRKIVLSSIFVSIATLGWSADVAVPKLRPTSAISEAFPQVELPGIPRPQLRPENLISFPQISLPPEDSPSPKARPKDLTIAMGKSKRKAKRGVLCGVKGIEGKAVTPIKQGRCGIEAPIRITAINGVKFSTPATLDCTTAKAVQKWLERKAEPVFAKKGGINSMQVVASYACRNRNSAASGRLSEHAFGHAIDIAGFTLGTGERVSVLKGWNGKDGKALRKLHKGACGIFGTVLGPDANAQHRDHFHFDTARYRSGSYCR